METTNDKSEFCWFKDLFFLLFLTWVLHFPSWVFFGLWFLYVMGNEFLSIKNSTTPQPPTHHHHKPFFLYLNLCHFLSIEPVLNQEFATNNWIHREIWVQHQSIDKPKIEFGNKINLIKSNHIVEPGSFSYVLAQLAYVGYFQWWNQEFCVFLIWEHSGLEG